MNNTARIINWGVTAANPLAALLVAKGLPVKTDEFMLTGEFRDHHKLGDSLEGMLGHTGVIQSINGRTVTTQSTVWTLEGPPEQSYLNALERDGLEYDEENPLEPVKKLIEKFRGPAH